MFRKNYWYEMYKLECLKTKNLEEENSKLILGNKSLSERLTSVTREKLDLQKENAELKEKYKASQELVTYYKSILKGE